MLTLAPCAAFVEGVLVPCAVIAERFGAVAVAEPIVRLEVLLVESVAL